MKLDQTRYVKPSDTRSLRSPMVFLPMVGDPPIGESSTGRKPKAVDRRWEVYVHTFQQKGVVK